MHTGGRGMDNHEEIKHLREIIKQKEAEILSLKEEINRLKKEYEQNIETENHNISYDVNLSSLWSL